MSLRVCVLASGSSGNSIFVSSESTAILIDAGITGKAMGERLAAISADPEGIGAVCLSHEHDDHMRGLPVLQKRYGWPVYTNQGTLEGLQRHPKLRTVTCNVFSTGSPFAIGDLTVESFSVPHDAFEPVGFVVTCGEERVGVATDVGIPTALIRERLTGCQTLVVEANHDEQMLMNAPRPWHLKQRIRGRQGHLSNHVAAEMIADIAHPGLSQVFLAHMSRDCNAEHLAVRATEASLSRRGFDHVRVVPTYPDRPSEIWTA